MRGSQTTSIQEIREAISQRIPAVCNGVIGGLGGGGGVPGMKKKCHCNSVLYSW